MPDELQKKSIVASHNCAAAFSPVLFWVLAGRVAAGSELPYGVRRSLAISRGFSSLRSP
jgi:hypothetical protein